MSKNSSDDEEEVEDDDGYEDDVHYFPVQFSSQHAKNLSMKEEGEEEDSGRLDEKLPSTRHTRDGDDEDIGSHQSNDDVADSDDDHRLGLKSSKKKRKSTRTATTTTTKNRTTSNKTRKKRKTTTTRSRKVVVDDDHDDDDDDDHDDDTNNDRVEDEDTDAAVDSIKKKKTRKRGRPQTSTPPKSVEEETIMVKEEQMEEEDNNGDDDEDYLENEDDNDDEAEEEEEPTMTRRSTRKRSKVGPTVTKGSSGRGPEENRTCPYCQKVCSTKHGLKYHLDNFVCRPEARPPDPPLPETVGEEKKKIRRRGKAIVKPQEDGTTTNTGSDGTKSKRRFRGSLEDRTCPHCGRIFSSQLGCNYHIKHMVCQLQNPNVVGGGGSGGGSTTGTTNKNTCWLGILEPGSKFITQFGIVQVVRDDRDVPTGELATDIKKKLQSYQSQKKRMEVRKMKKHDEASSLLRVRRNKINTLYEKGIRNKSLTFHAYFEKYSLTCTSPGDRLAKPPPIVGEPSLEDPYAMKSFCPDRIVECILIPDERQRYLSAETHTPIDITESALTGTKPIKMFLKRRLLTEVYNPSAPVYLCIDCGRKFSSFAGMRYHCTAKVCIESNLKESEKRMKRQEKIESSRQYYSTIRLPPPPQQQQPRQSQRNHGIHGSSTTTRETRKKKSKAPTAMYPEVLISLGFHLLKQDMKFDHVQNLPLIKPDDWIVGYSEGGGGGGGGDVRNHDDTPDPTRRMVDPSQLVESLRRQVSKQQKDYQLVAADQKHGTMYKEVFKSLGYIRGPTRPRRHTLSAVRKRRLSSKLPDGTIAVISSPQPIRPKPPIIDTRALADEILAGRYPSIKKYEGDDHYDYCAMCKDGGDLICCDFCRNAEHLSCLRERFTVKDPEPEDYFICHRCIGMINSRRNRAEKRRLEKQQREDERQKNDALEEKRLNPGIQSGMEYPYMAEKAKEMNELVELLQDAQTRLKQALATSRMNKMRRKAMGCFYTEKLP